jgi:adenine-specific DNA methylase
MRIYQIFLLLDEAEYPESVSRAFFRSRYAESGGTCRNTLSTRGREAAERFFLEGMSRAIANMAAQSSDAFPATIYYAFKQSEIDQEGISSTGWATFLQAVVEAGYAVVGTWPCALRWRTA